MESDFIIQAYETIRKLHKKPRFVYDGKTWTHPKTHPSAKEIKKMTSEKDVKKYVGEIFNKVVDNQKSPPEGATFICTCKYKSKKHRKICTEMFGVDEPGGWVK